MKPATTNVVPPEESRRGRRIADELADAFASNGIDVLFGLFGDNNLTFMAAMAQRGSRVVHARHEAAAVFMAGGHCRATGGPALASVTAGPGVAHTLTPLVSAVRAELPLVLYAGDVSRSSFGGLQNFDHRRFAELAGAQFLLADESRTPAASVSEALRMAVTASRPVVLSVPEDFMDAPATNGNGAVIGDAPPPVPGSARPAAAVAPQAAAERVAAALAASNAPLIVAGSGASSPDTLARLRGIARANNAMLATTFRAKGSLDDDPAYVGIVGPLAHRLQQHAQQRADLIVGFGANLHGFAAFTENLFECPAVCVGSERYGPITEPHPAGCDLDADVDEVVLLLTGDRAAPAGSMPAVAPDAPVVDRDQAIDDDFAELPEVFQPGELDPRRLLMAMDDVLPDDCVVVIGGGHFWSWPLLYLTSKRRQFLFPIEFGSIGMALPTGIGVAAGTGRRVVVIEGDGGVTASLPEIETAVRHRIELTLVVMNDAALGAEYHKLAGKGLTPDDSAYPAVDFAAAASGFGAQGHLLRQPDDLRLLTTDPYRPGGVTVFDARLTRRVTSRWYRRLYLRTA